MAGRVMSRKKGRKAISLAKMTALPVPSMSLANENAPTPERILKLPGVTIASSVATRGLEAVFRSPADRPVRADQVVRINQAPLDRLAARKLLDPRSEDRNRLLHEAGERVRQHWHGAGLTGIGSVDFNRAGGGSGNAAWATPTSETAAYHRDRLRRLYDTIRCREIFSILIGVCCEEQDLETLGRLQGYGNHATAKAAATALLRSGLSITAEALGILPPQPGNDNAMGLRALSA